MEFQLGLVSISFRSLSFEQIIARVKAAGLASVEWGGDVHVPAGRADVAHLVREATEAAGLAVSEYGSYYRLGFSLPEEIDAVVACARALGTDTVRVWAYNKGSAEATGEEYRRTVSDARRICAQFPDLTFCTECHNNTLTDDYRANLRLLEDVGMANFASFWQPNQHKSFAYNMESARALSPFVKAVHTFAWEGNERFPLAEHRDRWVEYLSVFAQEPKIKVMLEFMHDDSPDSLSTTAAELKNIISAVQGTQR